MRNVIFCSKMSYQQTIELFDVKMGFSVHVSSWLEMWAGKRSMLDRRNKETESVSKYKFFEFSRIPICKKVLDGFKNKKKRRKGLCIFFEFLNQTLMININNLVKLFARLKERIINNTIPLSTKGKKLTNSLKALNLCD